MKWFLMILSFLLTRMSIKQRAGSFAWDMYEEVVYKSRQVTMLALVALGMAVLFCAGILISLLNLTSQYDLNGFVTFTATLAMGLTLVAIAAGTFTWVFVSAWPGVRNRKLAAKKKMEQINQQEEEKKEEHTHFGSSIEHAISAWIMDVVKDREIRRTDRAARRYPTPPTATATTPSATAASYETGMNSYTSTSTGPGVTSTPTGRTSTTTTSAEPRGPLRTEKTENRSPLH